MGLFTRKDSASSASPSRPRPSVSSEVQAAELRERARRRLAGAVALTLAAVIVLPMLLDSEPVPVANDIPIWMPDRNAPYQPQLSPSVLADASGRGNGTSSTNSTSAGSPPPAASGTVSAMPVPPAVVPPPVAAPPVVTRPPVVAPAPPRSTQRDDDGARALALLEGRAPSDTPAKPAPKPAARGNFVLQIASYTAQTDAQSRRSTLHQAGITNAFVEQATISGKPQYRLRVGPFPSRDAAQAAQARLRTLGYDNGFIASQ